MKMFDRARLGRRSRTKRSVRFFALLVVCALAVPGVATSTVPPVHKPTDLSNWVTSPKVAPPKDYVQYSECQVQNKVPPRAQPAQYCDPPSSSTGGSPPTYWTAYYSMEYVWKGKTYRHEVTVPFSSDPNRPSSSRLLVDKIRVEFTGPTSAPLLLDLSLYNGANGARPIDDCCALFRHKPAYSYKDRPSNHRVGASSSQVSGTIWFAYSSEEAMESPLDNFELPIVAQRVDHFNTTDEAATCYTYDWQPYRCTGYFSIKPM